jgi:hypothetical protein
MNLFQKKKFMTLVCCDFSTYFERNSFKKKLKIKKYFFPKTLKIDKYLIFFIKIFSQALTLTIPEDKKCVVIFSVLWLDIL